MHDMHIAGIDLNLAVVLRALLEERNVSRAGRRLALSQSATSHALARLRHLLGDPLFVRTPTGLVPTARALAVHEPLSHALDAIERALFAPPVFDPAVARHTFSVATADYAEHLLMPALLAQLSTAAPHMNIWSRAPSDDPREALARGEHDLFIGPLNTLERTDDLHHLDLWNDSFVVVMRKGHPLARGPLTLRRYAEARHAFIAPRGRPGGPVDEALARHGLTRHIAFHTPNFLATPQAIAKTDLIITMAARIARSFSSMLPLLVREPPVELAGFGVAMFWHERRHSDPAHAFFRTQVVRATKAMH